MKYICIAALVASASAVSLSDLPAWTADNRKADAPPANTYPPYANGNPYWPMSGDKDKDINVNKHDVAAEKAVAAPEDKAAAKGDAPAKAALEPAATAEGGKKDADATKKEAAAKK